MASLQTFEFYTERADQSAAEASTAALANVRERALRSEKTWRGLAAQAQRTLAERAKNESLRDERRAAEAEETAFARMAAEPSPEIAA
ncbi:MAG TPA: hypothetical protein VI168_12270 [Croceibacterium sp.]